MRRQLFIGALLLSSAAEAQVQRWEYGTMTLVTSREGRTFYWVAPNEDVTAGSMFDFWWFVTKTKWDTVKEKQPLNLNLFLNFFGKQGWELVGVSGAHKIDDVANYYFKRRLN